MRLVEFLTFLFSESGFQNPFVYLPKYTYFLMPLVKVCAINPTNSNRRQTCSQAPFVSLAERRKIVQRLQDSAGLYQAGDCRAPRVFRPRPTPGLRRPLPAGRTGRQGRVRQWSHRAGVASSPVTEHEHGKMQTCVLLQVITDLFMAGGETSSTALLWAFLFLVKHPEVQEKCRDEIRNVMLKHVNAGTILHLHR